LGDGVSGRRQGEGRREVVGRPPRLALGLTEDDHLLSFADELADQWDDPILARPLPELRPDQRFRDPLLPRRRVNEPEPAVYQQKAFIERHRPLGAAQQPGAEPVLQAIRIADHCGERDDLGLEPFAAAHSEERKNELEVGAPALVSDHLRLVDHDDASLRQDMREGQRDRRELLIGQQRDVVLAAQQRRDVIGLPRRLDRADAEAAVDSIEVTFLVGNERLTNRSVI
jgi:hypothetical protein